MGNRDGSGPSLVTERERGSTEASRLNEPYCRGICNDASSPLYRLLSQPLPGEVEKHPPSPPPPAQSAPEEL
jgi:hypothetical protein